jgi:hypothetical protein
VKSPAGITVQRAKQLDYKKSPEGTKMHGRDSVHRPAIRGVISICRERQSSKYNDKGGAVPRPMAADVLERGPSF